MKTQKLFLGFIMLMNIIMFNGCKKDGATGPTGATGETGATGNANVKSVKFSLAISSFIGPLTDNEWSKPYAISSSNITIGEWDAVLLYIFKENIGSTSYYIQLPYNDYFNTSSNFNHFYFEHGSTGSNNILDIYIRNSSGAQPYSTMSGTLYFKCVVIQGTQGIKAKVPDEINANDYDQVREYYHLAD